MSGELRKRSDVLGQAEVGRGPLAEMARSYPPNDEGAVVTVHYGKDLYSAAPYNTFEVGPFIVVVTVKAGETIASATASARTQLAAIAQHEFEAKAKRFLANLNGLLEQASARR